MFNEFHHKPCGLDWTLSSVWETLIIYTNNNRDGFTKIINWKVDQSVSWGGGGGERLVFR